jgi:hypothetical protein
MEIDEYIRDFCARASEGAFVSFKSDAGFDGWEPQVGGCHENVDYWVAHHEGDAAVRGWLAFADYGSGLVGYTAHSVVRGNDGVFFDITPFSNPSVQRGFFIPHLGDDASFLEMRKVSIEIRCQGNCPATPIDPSDFVQNYLLEMDE